MTLREALLQLARQLQSAGKHGGGLTAGECRSSCTKCEAEEVIALLGPTATKVGGS